MNRIKGWFARRWLDHVPLDVLIEQVVYRHHIGLFDDFYGDMVTKMIEEYFTDKNITTNEIKAPLELTFEQQQAISKFMEDFASNPSNSNKQRYGLFAYINETVLSHYVPKGQVEIAGLDARISLIGVLRQKMEKSTYETGMGAWTVLHNEKESLEAQRAALRKGEKQ